MCSSLCKHWPLFTSVRQKKKKNSILGGRNKDWWLIADRAWEECFMWLGYLLLNIFLTLFLCNSPSRYVHGIISQVKFINLAGRWFQTCSRSATYRRNTDGKVPRIPEMLVVMTSVNNTSRSCCKQHNAGITLSVVIQSSEIMVE